MKTPAGKECRYYYEDFHRGNSTMECRLLNKNREAQHKWQESDCKDCAAPAILRANASEDLQLQAIIKVGFLGLGRRVEVTSRCAKHHSIIANPYVGCEQCANERPDISNFFVNGEA